MKKNLLLGLATVAFLVAAGLILATPSETQVTFVSGTWSIEGDQLHFDVVITDTEFPVMELYNTRGNRPNVVVKGTPVEGGIRFTDEGKKIHKSQIAFVLMDKESGGDSRLFSYVDENSESGLPTIGVWQNRDMSHSWIFKTPEQDRLQKFAGMLSQWLRYALS